MMYPAEFAGVVARPCPFCGESKRLVWERVTHNQALMWSVVCRNIDCFAQGPVDLGRSGAIAKWNNATRIASDVSTSFNSL